MKHIKTYKLFESISHFDDIKSNLKDLCLEFEDNNCETRIIHLFLGEYRIGSSYVEIDVFDTIKSNSSQWYDSEIGQNVQIFALPDWFISNCRRIEDYMQSEGFITKPSIRYRLDRSLIGIDWENPWRSKELESIDELADEVSLIYKVKLEFIHNEASKDI